MARDNLDSGLIRVGISSCLLGKKVRFDGGHKRDRYLTDILGDYFKFVPVCPEIEVGMGVPREAVRLEGETESPRMVGNKTGQDWTDRMSQYVDRRVKRADIGGLRGFILKSRSPSCGMERVKVYPKPGSVAVKGVGLFARGLLETHPNLPVEEEGRLNDAGLRDNFIVRVFAYHRVRQLFDQPFRRGAIVDFHAAHKFLVLAHSPRHYTELGRLVAKIKGLSPAQFKQEYTELFMQGLKLKSTVKKNVNVLMHIAGFLKKLATPQEKKDIQSAITDYHRELVPLVVPITLMGHFVRKYKIDYVKNQIYLNPHPKELMLRNHV